MLQTVEQLCANAAQWPAEQLRSVCRLFGKLAPDLSHSRMNSQAVSTVSRRQVRLALASLYRTMCARWPRDECSHAAASEPDAGQRLSDDTHAHTCDMRALGELALRLNSYDKKYVEQPDFGERLDAFRALCSLFSDALSQSVSQSLSTDSGHSSQSKSLHYPLDAGQLLFQNALFTLKHSEDLSLRVQSSQIVQQALEALHPHLEQPVNDALAHASGGASGGEFVFRGLVSSLLLPELLDGLRSLRNEQVRCEYIGLLGLLVRRFARASELEELLPLADAAEPDNDFFEIVRALQVAKRTKAIRRLVRALDGTATAPDASIATPSTSNSSTTAPQQQSSFRFTSSSSSIEHVLVPIVSYFITDASFAKYPLLQQNCFEALAALARRLPWRPYSLLLQRSLLLLVKASSGADAEVKTLTKTIGAVLDGFSFDLRDDTASTTATSNADNADSQEATPMDVSCSSSAAQQLSTATAPSKQRATILRALTRTFLPLLKKLLEGQTATLADEPKELTSSSAQSKGRGSSSGTRSGARSSGSLTVIPLAVAFVKLLKKLPQSTLDEYVPGIVMRLVAGLKSRSTESRETTCATLRRVSLALGVKYIPLLVRELKELLTRGYQVHVLGVAVHVVLKAFALDSKAVLLQPGDLDEVVDRVHQIYLQELFGDVARAKDSNEGPRAPLKEAKSTKAYDVYEMLARFVSNEKLWSLLEPLVRQLESTRQHKQLVKLTTLFRHLSSGLILNTALTVDKSMATVNELLTHTLQLIREKQQQRTGNTEQTAEGQVSRADRRPPDCRLLAPTPKRQGQLASSTTCRWANLHLVLTLALELLLFNLKRGRLDPVAPAHAQLLADLLPPLADCLEQSNVRLLTVAVRCFAWVFRYSSLLEPSFKAVAARSVCQLFVLLRKYSVAVANATGANASGPNEELVRSTFRALTVYVREVHTLALEEEQLRVLIHYAEADLFACVERKQSTALGLLKTLVARKLHSPELLEAVHRTRELAVTAESAQTQLEARLVVLHFLLEYPIRARERVRTIEFFASQLQYGVESGRRSALEMLHLVIKHFPARLLDSLAPGLIFLPLLLTLANDSSAVCRKLAAALIQQLLARVGICPILYS